MVVITQNSRMFSTLDDMHIFKTMYSCTFSHFFPFSVSLDQTYDNLFWSHIVFSHSWEVILNYPLFFLGHVYSLWNAFIALKCPNFWILMYLHNLCCHLTNYSLSGCVIFWDSDVLLWRRSELPTYATF